MNKNIFSLSVILLFSFQSFCQEFNDLSRTEAKDNAGLIATKSGFFQSAQPINYPTGATSWWHLLDVRHTNTAYNYAMQFAGSFFDQNLYFRKTNNNASQPWSKVVFETSGKVGIGTNTPQNKLHIYSAAADPLGSVITMERWTDVALIGGVRFGSSYINPVNGIPIWSGIDAYGTGGVDQMDLRFYTSYGAGQQNQERMRINQFGYVGIGINSPLDKLHVVGNISLGSNTSSQLFFRYGGSGTGGDITGVQNGTQMMSFGFNNEGSFSGSPGASSGREIYFYDRVANLFRGSVDALGTWWFGSSTSNYGLKIDAQSAASAAMTINSSGKVGIGTLNPQEMLSVNGNVLAKKVRVSVLTADWPDYVFDKTYQLPALRDIENFINNNKHLPEVPSTMEIDKTGIDLGDMQSKLLKKIEELTLYMIDQNKRIEVQSAEISNLKQQINLIKNN